MNLRKSLWSLSLATTLTYGLGIAATACSGDSQPSNPGADIGGSSATGGQTSLATGGASSANLGGSQASGGSGGATTSAVDSGGTVASTGGEASTGGKTGVGGTSAKSIGGTAGVGGTKSSGGTNASGGTKNTGGTSAKSVGGTNSGGGTSGIGGTQSDGGTAGTGGSKAVGGTVGVGGSKAVGGSAAVGGSINVGGTRAVGGTTAAGGTSSTSTQGTGYCPASEPCRISPLGDSITEGMGWTPPGASTWGGGYRVKLFSLGNTDAKNFTFVGTRSNGPSTVDNKPFPKNHEGTSGISIEDLQKNVVDAGKLTGSAVKPHIILLHIGTNNMYNSHPATPDVLMGSLLDKIIAACPDALLVVAKIIPYPGNTSGIQSFNDKLPALVQDRANKGAHIVLVDQFTGFPTSELSDGVHPNEAGYARMAGIWYKAISQYLH